MTSRFVAPAARAVRFVRWMVTHRGTVGERAMRGGAWLLIGDGFQKAAGLVKLGILSRLLAPDDFGVMAIAMAAVAAVEYLSEPGFHAALIQRPGDARPYLDAVWTAQIARSFVLATLLVAAAPLGGWFFASPEATPVLRAVALVVLLRGLANPALIHLRRELDFRQVVLCRTVGVAAGLVTGVGIALVTPSVWALLASVVAAQAGETIASYLTVPYRPQLRVDRRRLAELAGFGKWIFAANVLAFIGLHVDGLALAKLSGTAALGYYRLAMELALMPTAVIGAHVRGVVFPAFSKLSAGAAQQRAYVLTLGGVAALVVPVAVAVTLFAAPLVELVLGARWSAAAPALALLVWMGAGSALSAVVNALFQARGRPDLVVKLALVQIGLWAALAYPLTAAHGITGMAAAVTAAVLIALAAKLLVAHRLLDLRARDLLTTVRGACAAGFGARGRAA